MRQGKARKQIKSGLAALLALLLLFISGVPVGGESAVAVKGIPNPGGAITTKAKHAVVIDAETGEVLYEKRAHEQAPMASTTKIMTTLLLLEAGSPEKTIKVTSQMIAAEGTSMGLKDGDTVTREALAAGMLLSSGNDAANATAYHLAGSLPAFAKKMNARAKKIGMKNTNFVTPSGLDDEFHYSSAYDMALLGREAMKNEAFRKLAATRSMSLTYGDPPATHWFSNHNSLLKRYPYAVGIKTGFTQKSGRTLVSAAEKDGRLLIAVTLSDPDDWADHAKMFDYGFSLYEPTVLDAKVPSEKLPVVGGTKNTVSLSYPWKPVGIVHGNPGTMMRQVLLRPFEYAPIAKGQVLGTVRYILPESGRIIAEVPLIAAESVAAKPKK